MKLVVGSVMVVQVGQLLADKGRKALVNDRLCVAESSGLADSTRV